MRLLTDWLIGWLVQFSKHFDVVFAPLFARITVTGWVFLLSVSGASSTTCRKVTENFIGWGISFPHFFTPLTSGIEFFGGLFLLLGLLTRISAGALL